MQSRAEKTSELRESLADKVSKAARSHLKLHSQASISNRDSLKHRRKLNVRLNKTVGRRGNDSTDAFETKSLVSQRQALSKERVREDRSLNILTKRALKQLRDKEHGYATNSIGVMSGQISTARGERQADHISECSSKLKQTVKRTMYSAFPESKGEKKAMSKLGEVQAKAQLDALKRFI